MSSIDTYLQQILSAVYGEQVRGAIHDSIEQCYKDTIAGKTIAEGLVDTYAFATGSVVLTEWVDGKSYVIPTTTTVMPVDGYTNTTNFTCTYSACNPGDVFYITGTGGSGSKLYAWTQDDGTILYRADSNLVVKGMRIVAPANAAYLLVNSDSRVAHKVVKGDGVIGDGLIPYNTTNLMSVWYKPNVVTSSGLSFDWIGPSTCHISGTAGSSAAGCVILGSSSGILPYLEAGKSYSFRKSSTNSNLWFRFRCLDSQGTILREKYAPNSGSYGILVIPENTVNTNLAIILAGNSSIDEIVSFEVLSKTPEEVDTEYIVNDNRFNFLAPFCRPEYTSTGGCVFSWNGLECTISGNFASGTTSSFQTIYSSEEPKFPYAFVPGETLFIQESINPAFLELRSYDESGSALDSYTYIGTSGDTYVVPENAKRIGIRLGVSVASGYDGTAFTCRPNLYVKKGPIIPPPRSNGTYTFKCTVTGGVPTYAWVRD